MSVVGPRPPLDREVKTYDDRTRRRLLIRPGITGLWQVSGRSDTTYRRRVALDVAYSKHRSLGLNIKIMMMTVPAVLAAKGSR